MSASKLKPRLSKPLEDELLKTYQPPTWESRNEGIHERVNFEDTIWGFSLAGGAYYDTPLRITQVKTNSRAERAGIRVGDILKSINDIDTTTLTIQEAHDMILKSGIEIKLGVVAPDVEETTYHVYQDEVEYEDEEKEDPEELEQSLENKLFRGAKVNATWSIIWPCNKKRDVIYRESNCFMVPSRYLQKRS